MRRSDVAPALRPFINLTIGLYQPTAIDDLQLAPCERKKNIARTEPRSFANPEAAARKLMEIANSVEPVQDGRIHTELINWPFLQEHRGSPAEYKAGLDFAIERSWLRLHESGTYAEFTQAGSELFALTLRGLLGPGMPIRAGFVCFAVKSRAGVDLAIEFERYLDLRAIGFHLSLPVQLHIEFDDFCDAKIAEGFGGFFDRVGGGLFPGFVAGTDQLDHIVDALRHVVLPFGMEAGNWVLPAASEPNITISALKRCDVACDSSP
jgi:hypothetical protein